MVVLTAYGRLLTTKLPIQLELDDHRVMGNHESSRTEQQTRRIYFIDVINMQMCCYNWLGVQGWMGTHLPCSRWSMLNRAVGNTQGRRAE